jgi:hypothetical protein
MSAPPMGHFCMQINSLVSASWDASGWVVVCIISPKRLTLCVNYEIATHRMKRFKSTRQAQRFLGTHAAVYNLFSLGRHLVSSSHYRHLRISAFAKWGVAVARSRVEDFYGLVRLTCENPKMLCLSAIQVFDSRGIFDFTVYNGADTYAA